MADVAKLCGANKARFLYWCDGCETLHVCTILPEQGRPHWDWNGSLETPTLSPSVLNRTGRAVDPAFVPESGDPPEVCHTFIRNGVVEFLADCTHALAGQSVPLRAVLEWPE